MDYKLKPVSLDRIETADHTFKITTQTDKNDLALSISAIGLLEPPVLIGKGRNHTVVSGFRRIEACNELNIGSIPSRLLHPDTSGITCAQIAISDNSFQRQLNVVEQSRAFALLLKFVDNSKSWMNIAESTGLPGSHGAMERILPVAGMPLSLQEAILNGSIALPIALHIHRLNEDDAMALGDFFQEITTSLNIQRELLELVSEISIREDISICSLLKHDDIAAVLENYDTPTPQKVQQLRMMLKTKRNPELRKAEASYNQKVKSLKLNSHVQLHPPRFFEGQSYRLTLTVDSRQQLKSLLSELEKLIHHPNLLPK